MNRDASTVEAPQRANFDQRCRTVTLGMISHQILDPISNASAPIQCQHFSMIIEEDFIFHRYVIKFQVCWTASSLDNVN